MGVRKWKRSVWILVAVAAVGGCGAEGGGDATLGEVSAFVAEGPEVRIGAVDDPDYAFGSVMALAEGPDGRIYTLHRNEAFVRRWTADGLPDGQIGGPGEGPGEFTTPGSLGFFGDSLWVVDRRAYRANYFTPDGDFLGSVTPGIEFEDSPPRPERPLHDGRWYGRKPAWSDAIVRGELSRIPHVLMTQEGETLDTAWVQEYRPSDILGLLNEDSPGGTYGPQPFGDAPLSTLADDGTLVVLERRVWSGDEAEEPTFRVLRLNLEGDTLLDRRITYVPEPLPRARVDSAVDARVEQLFGFMSRRQEGLAIGELERRYRDALFHPDYLPAVGGLHAAKDGSIWLKRFDPVDGADEWWVLDGEGRMSRTVRLPLGFRLLEAGPERVWGVETDELDVNYIVRYALEPAVGT